MNKLFTEEFKVNEIMIYSKDYPNGISSVSHPDKPCLPATLKCYIGKEGYQSKPTEEYDFIKQRMRYSFIGETEGDCREGGLINDWTLEEVREYLADGHSIQNGEFREPEEGEKDLSFSGAQMIKANMIILDIEKGNPEIEDILDVVKPFRPTLIYKTLSYRKSRRKFRVIFVLNEYIDSILYQSITEYLINSVPGANKKCRDIGRVYLGGKGISFFEPNITLVEDFKAIPEIAALKEEKERVNSGGEVIRKKIVLTEKKIANYFKKQEGKKNIEISQTFKYINGFSLSEMIGVNVGDRFRCIMSDHNDVKPSATIIELNGVEKYRCHECEEKRAQSMLNVVMNLTGKTRNESVQFILKHVGTQVDSEYRRKALTALQFNRIFLTKNQETDIYQKLKTKRLLGTYIAFINYVENYLPNYPVEKGSISMFISIRHLSKTFKDWRIKGSAVSTVSNKMRDLTAYGLVEKIDYKDLPETFRRASEKNRDKNGYNYSVTYWRIPELSDEITERALEMMKNEKDSGYTKRYVNRTQMLRMHGKKDTQKVYNQDKMIYSDFINDKIEEAAVRLMKEQGYFTKSQMLSATTANNRQINQYLPGIAKEFGYKYKTISDEIRKELNIDMPRGSKLYIDEFGIF